MIEIKTSNFRVLLPLCSATLLLVYLLCGGRMGTPDQGDIQQVVRFTTLLRTYGVVHGSYPGPTLGVAAKALIEDEAANGFHDSVNWQLIMEGKSPSGNYYIYDWSNNGRQARLSTGKTCIPGTPPCLIIVGQTLKIDGLRQISATAATAR